MSAQAMQALAVANDHRLARAALRVEIRTSPTTIALALAAGQIACPDPCADSWIVYDLIGRVPRMGRARTLRLLRSAGVAEGRAVGALTQRERDSLVEQLGRLA